MRVLFVAPYVPSPIRVRPFHFVRCLAEAGHAVTVAALGTDTPPADADAQRELAPFCEAVHVVPHSRWHGAVQSALHLLTPTPLWAAYCFSPAMEHLLRELTAQTRFDVAHIEHLRAARFVRALPPTLPAVFDSVDCITDLQGQFARARSRGWLSRALAWEEWVKLKRWEPRAAACFSRVLATSRHDADALQSLAAAQGRALPITVIPNGVDSDYFAPAPDAAAHPAHLILSGKMSYAANADAARFFCRDIFPRVRRARPDATLTLAGSGPPPDIVRLAAVPGSGMEVTGRVPDLRPFLAQAAVAVCPLRIGVGIQNKVLEAMAMALPVVATPLAARALSQAPLSVADGPQAFADAVVRLLDTPAQAQKMGQDARRFVLAHHDWRALTGRLAALYEETLQDAHYSPRSSEA